jgi:hypothetical protein
MANSATYTEVISLGQLLVKQLELDPGVDTLSRWIAHYLAEKINAVANSTGQEKKLAEEECVDIILKLWKHRWYFPRGSRPLENYQPLLELLQRLNNRDEAPTFYIDLPTNNRQEEKSAPSDPNTPQFWVEVTVQIDSVARTWLKESLAQVGKRASDTNSLEWINNALKDPIDTDIHIIRLVLDQQKHNDEENEFQKKYEIESIKKRLDELERFKYLNEFIIQLYREKLDALEK